MHTTHNVPHNVFWLHKWFATKLVLVLSDWSICFVQVGIVSCGSWGDEGGVGWRASQLLFSPSRVIECEAASGITRSLSTSLWRRSRSRLTLANLIINEHIKFLLLFFFLLFYCYLIYASLHWNMLPESETSSTSEEPLSSSQGFRPSAMQWVQGTGWILT